MGNRIPINVLSANAFEEDKQKQKQKSPDETMNVH